MNEAWEDVQAACEGVSEAYSGFGTELLYCVYVGAIIGFVVVVARYIIKHKGKHV